jgi:hypothetical protein
MNMGKLKCAKSHQGGLLTKKQAKSAAKGPIFDGAILPSSIKDAVPMLFCGVFGTLRAQKC